MTLWNRIETLIQQTLSQGGPVLFLTGAGLSAESGIPTFRGQDGYWTIGSRHYRPMELATYAQFSRTPGPVWSWYLSRRATYANTQPNSGHQAIVDIEKVLGQRFLLVTQNVDGLHQAAGSSDTKTLPIHGNIHKKRCFATCTTEVSSLPGLDKLPGNNPDLTEQEIAYLTCDRCGSWFRPHVLWFDESYNEEWYHYHTAITAAARASLLVIVGTSGATNLPIQMGQLAARQGAAIIDINPDRGHFASVAERSSRGEHIQTSAGEALPKLAEMFRRIIGEPPHPLES
ncbi:MAG: RNA polymerase subunit sigma [Myxococcales bacterium]|nr:RNA polymerase subunit sigma [Myxococcales bacterium]